MGWMFAFPPQPNSYVEALSRSAVVLEVEPSVVQSAFMPVGSTVIDSTKHGSKILEKKKKTPEISKKQNLNLPCTSNYLHSVYIILGIISNLEMI